MKQNNGSMETTTLLPVPQEERKPWGNVALIQAGIMISIPCLMLGETLSSGMPFWKAVLAVLIGFGIAVALMTFIGIQSSDTGRPMCVAASSAFGKLGTRIFLTILFSCALIAWFGYQTIVCGNAFTNMLSSSFGIHMNGTAAIIIWGIVMLVTAAWGINALTWLNNIAIPALVIVTIIGTIIALNTYGTQALTTYAPPDEQGISLFEGITLTFGAQSCGMVVTGDITRFQKSRKDTIKATCFGVLPASLLMIIMGYIMSALTQQSDITLVLCDLGLPILGMVVLILATWTTNTTNSYSAGIDMTMLFNLKDRKRVLMTIIAGALGTAIALCGIMDHFGTFLMICGYAFGPVAGVMIADYWILRRGNVEKWFYKDGFDWVGILSWAAGMVLTFMIGTDLAVFLGMLLSFLLFILLRKLIPEKQDMVQETVSQEETKIIE